MAMVTLVNLNQIDIPLVAPYALDVLASALTDGGHDVAVLDLNLERDPRAAIDAHFRRRAPDLVGVSLRNTGDLYFPSLFDLPTHGSCLQSHAALIGAITAWISTDRIVAGGVGFSSNPARLLERFGLPYGVIGPGEVVMREIADAVDRGISLSGPLSGALGLRRLPSSPRVTVLDGTKDPLAPRVRRMFVDNRKYYDAGGLAGVRTSNGCAMSCSYCVEPLAKGKGYTRRTIEDVIDEIDQLLAAGIYDIHTCDSEFNMPIAHCKRVLAAIAARDYPSRLRFWAYCQPKPFDAELARLMAAARVAGINFGVDHTDPAMLRRMGKTWYTLEDIQRATHLCHDHGIAVNHELLFGYPGDTPDAMFRAIDATLALRARAAGIVLGLAVLPGTALARLYQQRMAAGEPLDGFHMADEPLTDPTYFLDPSFPMPQIFDRLRSHIGDEIRRVMLPQLQCSASDSNQLVGSERIKQDLLNGKRGAYWYHYPSRQQSRPATGLPRHAESARAAR